MVQRSFVSRSSSVAVAALLMLAACADPNQERRAVAQVKPAAAHAPPIASDQPLPAEDGQWTMPAKNHASTRFSGLAEINTENARELRQVWSFSTGFVRGHEAAPIIVGDTMYIVTPYPNVVYALDLREAGRLKWKYDPKPAAASQGVACCDVVNRGGVYDGGRFFFNTLDGHTIGLDAASGQELWKTKLGDINKGETMTMAPLVAAGHVLVGNSGGEMGVRGWITALRVEDGSIAWKAFSTGPDADCLIGEGFHPFYEQDRGKDLGVRTWPPQAWQTGGGTVWGWISYDPETNLIFYGTGNAGPWNPDQRPGDNKWTSGIFARDASTGQARWFYQFSPHDLYDYDAINEQILTELEVSGRKRKVLIRPERNGYVYVMDRASGEVLSANAFTHITTTKGVDLKTGRVIHAEDKATGAGKLIRDICPAAPGGKDWNPSAWSPRTQLLYLPHNNLCMDFEGYEVSYIAGTPFVGANVKMYAGPGGNRGNFTAWDPVQGKAVWKLDEDLPVWSGALVTAGDVVFYGTMDGWFKALDARNGNALWRYKVGSGIIGQPVSYRGPDGKQYVAVLSGVGGWAGAIVAGELDPRDGSGALGFVNAMRDLPQKSTKGGMLHVFALP